MKLSRKKKLAKDKVRRFYYNDPEIGSCPESSHPNFVKIATDEFYYSCSDDFSPFGSDDGSDGLAMLEDWFKKGGRSNAVIHFLTDTIASAGLGVPQNLDGQTEQSMNAWLENDDIHDRYLAFDCRLRIAVAFGQLKICGKINAPILGEAKVGIRWMIFLNAWTSAKYPEWQYNELEVNRLSQMKAVLDCYKQQ